VLKSNDIKIRHVKLVAHTKAPKKNISRKKAENKEKKITK
jgi:hypothetical protein